MLKSQRLSQKSFKDIILEKARDRRDAFKEIIGDYPETKKKLGITDSNPNSASQSFT